MGLLLHIQGCKCAGFRYYEISFEPAPGAQRDEYHHLEIRIAKPGLNARTRQNYYAQPATATNTTSIWPTSDAHGGGNPR
jgi:hypothetical protein